MSTSGASRPLKLLTEPKGFRFKDKMVGNGITVTDGLVLEKTNSDYVVSVIVVFAF